MYLPLFFLARGRESTGRYRAERSSRYLPCLRDSLYRAKWKGEAVAIQADEKREVFHFTSLHLSCTLQLFEEKGCALCKGSTARSHCVCVCFAVKRNTEADACFVKRRNGLLLSVTKLTWKHQHDPFKKKKKRKNRGETKKKKKLQGRRRVISLPRGRVEPSVFFSLFLSFSLVLLPSSSQGCMEI